MSVFYVPITEGTDGIMPRFCSIFANVPKLMKNIQKNVQWIKVGNYETRCSLSGGVYILPHFNQVTEIRKASYVPNIFLIIKRFIFNFNFAWVRLKLKFER